MTTASWRRRARATLSPLRRRGRPVVVYTSGKTGSTTLEASLRRAVRTRPVHKVHWLLPAHIERSAAGYHEEPIHLRSSRALLRTPPSEGRPWDIIGLVREPLGQIVSSFFQNAERRGHDISDPAAARAAFRSDVDDLRRQLTWFEDELRPFLDLDVYALPFDHSAGVLQVDRPTFRFLLVRTEDLDRREDDIGTFLGTTFRYLPAENVGYQKEYGGVYRRFREEVALPASLVEEVCRSRTATHFYTPDEIAASRARWHVDPER